MFSNTAYEALYQIIGLQLHSRFVAAITSESFFKGLILITFGVLFFLTTINIASRYFPGSLVQRKQVPLSKYFKIVLLLFLGLSILRLGSNASVYSYDGRSWHENKYVVSKYGEVKTEYRVSLVFDILSRTAEEVAALISRVVDKAMASTNSQLGAPNFFYKAMMYSGSTTIDDPRLREAIQFYTEECFEKVIPLLEGTVGNKLDAFYKRSAAADEALANTTILMGGGEKTTCLEVKNSVRQDLLDYSKQRANLVITKNNKYLRDGVMTPQAYTNMVMSAALVNHHKSDKEAALGIRKGAQVKGAARIYQYLNRVFSWDGLVSIISFGAASNTHGAAEAGKRSQAFSEHLSRAPHVAGFIKMILIFIFPWLIFVVVAGRWKVLIWWFALYFSVLLWTPLWTLFYHIMTNIALSSEVMASFGKLNDGISLYSSELITSRIYYLYSIYSWVQILVGVMTTGTAFFFLRPMLSETQSEQAPDFVNTGVDVGKKAAGSFL